MCHPLDPSTGELLVVYRCFSGPSGTPRFRDETPVDFPCVSCNVGILCHTEDHGRGPGYPVPGPERGLFECLNNLSTGMCVRNVHVHFCVLS